MAVSTNEKNAKLCQNWSCGDKVTQFWICGTPYYLVDEWS